MKEMTELKMVYELVISRANPLDNPRYELLNHAQRKMKEEILSVIRQTNPNYPEMDYDDDVFKYIVEFNDEYCIVRSISLGLILIAILKTKKISQVIFVYILLYKC